MMKKTVSVFGAEVPVFIEGEGVAPLLIVGPADLFRKNKMLPDKMGELFTIYFVDLFSDLISFDEVTVSKLTMSDFINAIDLIRSQLMLEKIALFAHSALGVLGYKYTLQHPENTLCLLMVAASPNWTEHKNKMSVDFFLSNASQERKKLYEADQKQFSQLLTSCSRDKFTNSYIAKRTLFFYDPRCTTVKSMWNDIYHCMPLISHYFKLINDCSMMAHQKINVPLFIAMGLYDASMPFYLWTDDMKETIGQSYYYIFENSAHYPIIEESEVFFSKLESFVNESVATKINKYC